MSPLAPTSTFPASAVLDSLIDGVIATDTGDEDGHDVRIVYVNQAACEITGYDADELLGESPSMLQGPATDRRVVQRLREDLASGWPFTGQTINYRKDGTPFVMEWSVSIVDDEDGESAFFVAIQRDATLPSRRLLQAEHEARTDRLTGLPNRSHIDRALEPGSWLSARVRAAVVVDLDHFKAINDTHGHLVGDEVLRQFAGRLTLASRSGDIVARWGGEEFCVLTLGEAGREADDAAALARRIVDTAAASPFATSAGEIAVTCSAGSASLGDGRMSALDLLAAADRAMFAAKHLGRNRAERA